MEPTEYEEVDRPAWHAYARCSGLRPAIFFTERGASTATAKSVCALCHVRAECLEWALVNRERFGIWGGKSERERRQIRKQRGLVGLRTEAQAQKVLP